MGKRAFRAASVMAMALSMAACANTVHRPRIMSDTIVDPEVTDAAKAYRASGINSTYELFVDAANLAYPTDIAAPVDAKAQRIFMETGFDLVKDRCRAYLERKSDHQRALNTWHDTFAPLTALLGGVVGLLDDGENINSKVLIGSGLATTTVTAGIEIYEERFLFNAKNVNSVRTLLDRALSVDAEEKLALPDSRLRYTKAAEHIASNQLICSPQNILELVQEAIENGDIATRSGREVDRNPDGSPRIPADGSSIPEPDGVSIRRKGQTK